MVVVEKQPRTLLIGVEEGQRPWAGIRHIRDVLHTHALGVSGRFVSRGYPLMRRPVTNPGRNAAMQVERSAVLGVILGTAIRPGACAHHRRIHRNKEVAARADGQLIGELDAHRSVALGHNRRAEDIGLADRRVSRVDLHVAPQQRGRQIRVQLLRILDEIDFVVVGAGIGRCVGNGDRNVLPKLVGVCRAQTGQLGDELTNAAVATAASIHRDRRHRINGERRVGGCAAAIEAANHNRGRGSVASAAVQHLNRRHHACLHRRDSAGSRAATAEKRDGRREGTVGEVGDGAEIIRGWPNRRRSRAAAGHRHGTVGVSGLCTLEQTDEPVDRRVNG